MSYTIKNISESEDLAAKAGFGELAEVRFPRDELGVQETGFAHQVLKPNKRSAFGHRHDEAEEVYVVLSGSGRMRLDDEIVEIGRLDAIRVAPSVMRAFEAGEDGLEVLVFGARHEGDGDLDHEFWKD
jgi:mannose-6-phosphate isomerase-like protein (cupin superfamily)